MVSAVATEAIPTQETDMYTDYRTATAIQSRKLHELRRSAAQHRDIEKDENPVEVKSHRRFSWRTLLAFVSPRHA